MTLMECYDKIGGDYPDTVRRLCKDTLIETFLLKFLNDKSFETLSDAISAKNGKDAFAAAHTLKGIALNLGLKALFIPTNELTEALRQGWCDEATELFEPVAKAYANTAATIRTWHDSKL